MKAHRVLLLAGVLTWTLLGSTSAQAQLSADAGVPDASADAGAGLDPDATVAPDAAAAPDDAAAAAADPSEGTSESTQTPESTEEAVEPAQDAEDAAAISPAPDGPPPEGTGERIHEPRAVPDYDGLPEPGTSAGEALLWIPRILTSPLYLVSEFILRRPIGWFMLNLEQVDLLGLTEDIFLFADNKIGLFPTVFFDFGFAPSFGLYFFWDDFLFEGNRFSMHGGTFGPQWLSAVVKDQITFSEDTHLTARFSAFTRPDQIFGDIGGDAELIISRFGINQIDTSLTFDTRIWRRSKFEGVFGYRSASFEDGRALGDPSISEEMIARGQTLPDGFVTGYSALRWGLDAQLDTREVTIRPNAGISLRLLGQLHIAVDGPQGINGWLRWGGALRASTDILGDDRILSIGAAVAFITPVNDAVVPFTELIDIGALGHVNGFLPGLIRGRSLAATVLAYEWPIWVFLNGRMHFALGNVFEEHLQGFDAQDLRMSFGIGVEPTLGGDLPFELAIAFGTDTFRNGPDVTSFRFVIGARNDL